MLKLGIGTLPSKKLSRAGHLNLPAKFEFSGLFLYRYQSIVGIWKFVDSSELKQRPQRRQREREKSSGFNKRNNNFARVHHTFVYISFIAITVRLRRENA